MHPERYTPDDPREWLNRARSNLIQAQTRRTGIYFEDLCFQCQQAAEKALKGILLVRQISFPYTHDISHLMEIIEEEDVEIPQELQEAVILSRYAVATRYPDTIEPVTEEDYEEALHLAAGIVKWAEGLISQGIDPEPTN